MARLARVVHPGIAYHVTHRGNRGSAVFFTDENRKLYLADLRGCAAEAGLAVWGYCLMTNHIHLIAVPSRGDSLARALARAQARHARRINAERGWGGHLWANRFFSTPLDDPHLWTAIKYVELNPVRARMVAEAAEWPWSSAAIHAGKAPDGGLLDRARPFGGTRPDPMTGQPISWEQWLALGVEEEQQEKLRKSTSTGRPCGGADFVARLESALDRTLTPKRRGRPKKG